MQPQIDRSQNWGTKVLDGTSNRIEGQPKTTKEIKNEEL
jgi:hypothetical protein